jgi:hypothetical protein
MSCVPSRLPTYSIRAAAWIGAQCVRQYCTGHAIDDKRIVAFCEYLEKLASARDLLAWEEEGAQLAVTGLGDPLPDDLASDPALVELVCYAHEIAASQMYGAWQPQRVAEFLRRAAALAGYDLDRVCQAGIFEKHNPDPSGWGEPIDEGTEECWRRAVQGEKKREEKG